MNTRRLCLTSLGVFISGFAQVALAALASKSEQDHAQEQIKTSSEYRTLEDLKADGLDLTVTIDFSHWDTAKEPQVETPIAECLGVLDGLLQTHKTPGWKQILDKNVHQLHCQFDGTHEASTQGELPEINRNQGKDFSLNNGVLTFHLNPKHTNIVEITFAGLERLLENVRVDGLTPSQYEPKATLAADQSSLVELAKANDACGTKLEMVIDWAHYDHKAWPAWQTAAAGCDAWADSVGNYCNLHGYGNDWSGKKQIQKKLKRIDCRFDGTRICDSKTPDPDTTMQTQAALQGSTLVAHLKYNQCNLPVAGQKILEKAYGK